MRRNQTTYIPESYPPTPPVTVTFPAFPEDLSLLTAGPGGLTPTEQHQRAVEIARYFRDHYLSEIIYRDDRHIAIAIIRPRADDIPYKICVDRDGNVSIYPFEVSVPTLHPIILKRAALAAGSMLAALGALLFMS